MFQLTRQTETRALLGVEPPTDASAFDPAVQCGQIALLDGEAFAQGRDVQQIENLADGEAAVREFEQVFNGDQQGIAAALALIGEGKGDEAGIDSVQLPEYRANMRRIAVDVGDHDDDVPWAKRGVGAEALEQLVVENLHFALGAVGNVEADGCITLQIDSRPLFPSLIERAQFEDIVLKLVEQCGGFAVAEQVDSTIAKSGAVAVGIVVTVQQADVVATLFAPGGQQRMGVLVQGLWVDSNGHAGFTRLAFVFVTQQVFVGHDVGPMVATRVVHAQQDLAETGQAGQRLKRLGG